MQFLCKRKETKERHLPLTFEKIKVKLREVLHLAFTCSDISCIFKITLLSLYVIDYGRWKYRIALEFQKEKSTNSTMTFLISKKLFTTELGYHPQYFPGTFFLFHENCHRHFCTPSLFGHRAQVCSLFSPVTLGWAQV